MHDPTGLTPAVQAALDAVDDEQLREAEMLCQSFDIPAEYARPVAAMVAACAPDGAL